MSEQKEDIYSIMAWYGNLPMHFRDIETLMYKRRLLVGMYGKMAQQYNKDIKEFNNKHADRRIKEAKELLVTLNDIDPKTEKYNTLGKSEATAIQNIEPEYRLVYALKGTIDGMKILMEAVDRCLQAMMQELADLRSLLGSNERTSQDTE